MIQDLIEKYEKMRIESRNLMDKLMRDGHSHSAEYNHGIVKTCDSILKDLRELEGKPECEHEMDFVYGPEGDYRGTVCFKCTHTGE